MCGIAGLMTRDGRPPEPAILDRLTAALAHRGPDGHGRHVRDDVGLVHARLSIIDLDTGGQPLFGPGGTALVANGEIYNNPELRAGVLADAPFSTGSDCEPILHLYAREGLAAVERLRGMCAFGLHDPEARRLVLWRDPFGIKPLYYAETGAGFAFASEPQALVAAGLVRAEADPARAVQLVQLQFTTGADTIFRGIRRVLPGEMLVVEGGRIVERRRTPALPVSAPKPIGEAEALAALDGILIDSINVHQRSDVPFGMFLSSGVDSSIILAGMARLADKPVLAYTASFPGSSLADEYPEAKRLSTALGARHINVEVRAEEFLALLPRIAATVDDPTADCAIVPTYILAREAAKDVKVILCGEGGDEVFGGYSRYRRQIRPWWLGGRVRRRTGPFSDAGILRAETGAWRDGIAAAEKDSARIYRDKLQAVRATDCVDFLPHSLLTKLDRCLMAHGVEGRTPMLDPIVGAFGFGLPQALLLRRRRGKYLLRRWLETHVPSTTPFAKKRGFTVPVGGWIRAAGERLGPLVAADAAVAELCRPETVPALFVSDDRTRQEAAWRLLFYALWHRRHIRGADCGGDVFAVLSERS